MGQQVGKMPKSPGELLEEHRRVLHWSAEVLARVDDQVEGENTFLMDYDDTEIASKVESWIAHQRPVILDANLEKRLAEVVPAKFVLSDVEMKGHWLDYLNGSVMFDLTMGIGIKYRMRKNYEKAYEEQGLDRLAKHVDRLAERQRRIHADILSLEKLIPHKTSQFRRRFGRLRLRVFDNLRASEKMGFCDRRLKRRFILAVADIDRQYKDKCEKKAKKLIGTIH